MLYGRGGNIAVYKVLTKCGYPEINVYALLVRCKVGGSGINFSDTEVAAEANWVRSGRSFPGSRLTANMLMRRHLKEINKLTSFAMRRVEYIDTAMEFMESRYALDAQINFYLLKYINEWAKERSHLRA